MAGTLDPLANGVLGEGNGDGTLDALLSLDTYSRRRRQGHQSPWTIPRVQQGVPPCDPVKFHLLTRAAACQSYRSTGLLGCATTSYDSDGPVLSTAPYKHVTREMVEGVLDKFRGDIRQVPPM